MSPSRGAAFRHWVPSVRTPGVGARAQRRRLDDHRFGDAALTACVTLPLAAAVLTFAWLSSSPGWPWWWSTPAALAAGFGLLLGYVSTWRWTTRQHGTEDRIAVLEARLDSLERHGPVASGPTPPAAPVGDPVEGPGPCGGGHG